MGAEYERLKAEREAWAREWEKFMQWFWRQIWPTKAP